MKIKFLIWMARSIPSLVRLVSRLRRKLLELNERISLLGMRAKRTYKRPTRFQNTLQKTGTYKKKEKKTPTNDGI